MNVCMYMTETGDMGERVMVFTLLFLLMKGPLLIQWIKMYMCNNVVKVNNKMNEFSNINESNVCYELFFFPLTEVILTHFFGTHTHFKGNWKVFSWNKTQREKKNNIYNIGRLNIVWWQSRKDNERFMKSLSIFGTTMTLMIH